MLEKSKKKSICSPRVLQLLSLILHQKFPFYQASFPIHIQRMMQQDQCRHCVDRNQRRYA